MSIGITHGIAFLGHVDSGKSTLVGRLLNKNLINQGGNYFFHFSYRRFEGTDDLREESERGITIVPRWYQLPLEKNRTLVLVDTPGHRDFIGSFIGALCGCQSAVLVVASPPGEFEAGFSKSGQTREHLVIAYTMGIKDLIIVITKMGQIRFAQDRFNEIASEIITFAQKVGYKKFQVIPADSMDKVNVMDTKNNQEMPWYQGPCVLEALSSIPFNDPTKQPLRFIVSRVRNVGGTSIVEGSILSGTIENGQTVYISPSPEKPDPSIVSGNWKLKGQKKQTTRNLPIKCMVKNIEAFKQPTQRADAGMFVGVSFKHSPRTVEAEFLTKLKRGQLISSSPVSPVKTFSAKVIVLQNNCTFRVGCTPLVFFHTDSTMCRLIQIVKKIDKRTGKNLPLTPTIKAGEAAVMKFTAARHVSLASLSSFSLMSRLVFHDNRTVVAVGLVIPSMIPWEQARLVWAGHLKNPGSPFSKLPRDMIHEILQKEQ